MGFKNFKFNIIFRVVLLTLTILLFGRLIYDSDASALTRLLISVVVIVQVISMIYFLDTTNREVVGFLNSIKYDDFSRTYPTKKTGTSIDLLNAEFNKVIKKFREIRAEKEAQYHYLKTIVQHVGIGIITFDKDGNIQIINTAAKKLLKVSQIKNVSQLGRISPPLVSSIYSLKTGGRDLIKIDTNGNNVQLAIYAIELTLRGEEFKLISLQNIQSELEEKEMEAWQNLIRVLTHEIMNSVTPISSLAATVEDDLHAQLTNDSEINTISNDDIEDLHLSVKTIHRRSKGLIRFVSDFRNLTKIPEPKREVFKVKEFVDQIVTLHKIDVERAQVNLMSSVEPADMTLNADRELIEQVLINLVKNAIQALELDDEKEEGVEKVIHFDAYRNDKNQVVIIVADNGPGIEEEAMAKIFIPFFTTKKSGSGIGLSLSKQIIRKHGGTINVKSTINEGTTFIIKL